MRNKAVGGLLAVLVGGLALPVPWRLATVRAVPQAGGSAVRPAPAGQRFGGKPGVRGATYYAFEGQAVRVTTTFDDATVVGRRAFDGDIDTTLSDRSGREVASFKVDAVDAATTVLQYTPFDGGGVRAFGEPTVRPTLDWSTRQAYSLWKERVASSTDALEWRGGLMRRKGGARDDAAANATASEVEWSDGLLARSVRKSVKNYQPLKDRTVSGDVLVTHLYRGGTEIGTLNWFAGSGLLMWDLPGLTRGYVAPEHLKEFGGWPFTPDLEWLNMQAYAFQHFKTLLQKQGFVARGPSSWPARIAQFFAPTLSANEPGCDDLHWLDGTILRFCCDVHDLCYEKNGCSSRSWWQFWTSWTCDACNAWVVICFVTGDGTFSSIGLMK
jgi:hypothetical protein